MGVLRGLLFDNLGLKLVALLLALIVYLHVFTERQATMVVSFPIRLSDLSDSLSLSGPVPDAVQAELRGTGKHFIRLWLTEPPLKLSLAGTGPGRFRRAVTAEDLPLPASDKLKVERMVGEPEISFLVERKVVRQVSVAPRVDVDPRSGSTWRGSVSPEPAAVLVRGPEQVVAGLDSVRLEAVRIDGRRDTVRAQVKAARLPPWCTMEPPTVAVTVALSRPES